MFDDDYREKSLEFSYAQNSAPEFVKELGIESAIFTVGIKSLNKKNLKTNGFEIFYIILISIYLLQSTTSR